MPSPCSNIQNVQKCDLLILGQGPAASAAAIRAAQLGVDVVMLGRPPSSNARPGETLPPAACPLLGQLGLTELVSEHHLPSPGLVSAWISSQFTEVDFLFNPYGQGWHLDRVLFDQQMVQQAVDLGVTVVTCDRLSSAYRCVNSRSWQVVADRGGQEVSFGSSFLIDATGRAAWLSHQLGCGPHKLDRLVGVVGFLNGTVDNDSRTYLEAVEDGWWYFADLPGKKSVATFMTDNDLVQECGDFKRLWHQRLRDSQRGMHISETLIAHDTTLRVAPSHTARLPKFIGPSWAAIGDAAAAWDPLSSQGLCTALESGIRVAEAWVEELQCDRTGSIQSVPIETGPVELKGYAEWLEGVWDNYRAAYQYYYAQVERWPHSTFWQRRGGGYFARNTTRYQDVFVPPS